MTVMSTTTATGRGYLDIPPTVIDHRSGTADRRGEWASEGHHPAVRGHLLVARAARLPREACPRPLADRAAAAKQHLILSRELPLLRRLPHHQLGLEALVLWRARRRPTQQASRRHSATPINRLGRGRRP
jgi:hypothetical protein